MRSHPVFASFNKRWQLPIYFQLRWKDIVGKVEDSLSSTDINHNFTDLGKNCVFGSYYSMLSRRVRAFRVSDASGRERVDCYKFMLERRNLHSRPGVSFLEVDSAGKNYSVSTI